MAITQEASGSHTISVVGNEESPTGASVTTTKTFVVVVDCNALAAGEYVQIKVKRDARSADATRILHTRIVSWLESAITPIIRMPADSAGGGEYAFTLRQIGGSARAFPWAIETPG